MKAAFHESTPLTQEDCLVILERQNKKFDFPIHFHIEYELNFIKNASGALRIVGDHSEVISNLELVLTGPNVVHGWEGNVCKSCNVTEYTIQFHRDLFSENLLHKKALSKIKQLLSSSSYGISFSKNAIEKVSPLIPELANKRNINALLSLIEILQILSQDTKHKKLSNEKQSMNDKHSYRIKKAFEYIELNFQKKLRLKDISSHLNMTTISFSRLFKAKTGKTFVEYLNDYRIQYAMRLMNETEDTMSEIAYLCGFSNQANFNRFFKVKNNCTPSEYRHNITEVSVIN